MVIVSPRWTVKPGPKTGFKFRWRHECIKLLEYHKGKKMLLRDTSFVLHFMFSLEKYALI